jgi:hypothetical protein
MLGYFDSLTNGLSNGAGYKLRIFGKTPPWATRDLLWVLTFFMNLEKDFSVRRD